MSVISEKHCLQEKMLAALHKLTPARERVCPDSAGNCFHFIFSGESFVLFFNLNLLAVTFYTEPNSRTEFIFPEMYCILLSRELNTLQLQKTQVNKAK